MPPAARVTDFHVCPMATGTVPHVGGPVIGPGAATVLIGGMPAAVVGDTPLPGPPDTIVDGSATVMIGGKPAARLGDSTAHGGTIMLGRLHCDDRLRRRVWRSKTPSSAAAGASRPPSTRTSRASTMSAGIRDIEESLRIIFTTALGERIMNPLFGCSPGRQRVRGDEHLAHFLSSRTWSATPIIFHEPRIDADQVTVEPDQIAGILLSASATRCEGRIRASTSSIPYYLQEK